MPKLAEPTRAFLLDLGAKLRASREARGLSQRIVAERIRTDRANYSRIERGRANVTVDTLIAIASALGVELHVGFDEPVELQEPAGRGRAASRDGARPKRSV